MNDWKLRQILADYAQGGVDIDGAVHAIKLLMQGDTLSQAQVTPSSGEGRNEVSKPKTICIECRWHNGLYLDDPWTAHRCCCLTARPFDPVTGITFPTGTGVYPVCRSINLGNCPHFETRPGRNEMSTEKTPNTERTYHAVSK